jgi:hypothetical protein
LNQQGFTIVKLWRLEALVEDQGERIRRFMKNDHRIPRRATLESDVRRRQNDEFVNHEVQVFRYNDQ